MKKNVLVVDDDPSVRSSLKKVLETSGYDVTLAAGGDEAEERYCDREFHLALLDLDMPRRDGWDVLGRLNSEFPLLPVIIVTGMSDQLDTTMIPGVKALLKKPIDAPVLLKAMEEILAESIEERLHRFVGSVPHTSSTPIRDPLQSRRFKGIR